MAIRIPSLFLLVAIAMLHAPVAQADLQTVCPEAYKHLQTAEQHRNAWLKHLQTMESIDAKKNASIGRAIDELREISFQNAIADAATDAAFEASQDIVELFGKRCMRVGAKVIGKANAIVSVLQTALSLSNIAPGVIDALGLNSAQAEAYANAQSAGAWEANRMEKAMAAYKAALEKCKCKRASKTPPVVGKDDSKEPSKSVQDEGGHPQRR